MRLMKQYLSFIAVTVLLLSCGCGATKKTSNTDNQEFTVEKMVKNYEDNKEGIGPNGGVTVLCLQFYVAWD